MKKYLYIIKTQIIKRLTYAFDVYGNILVQTIIMITSAFFWKALYKDGGTAGGVNVESMLVYIIMSSVLSVLLITNVEKRIEQSVQKGTVATDMMKPVSLFGIYFAEDIGNQQQSWASDNSAIYFDLIAIEGCAGDCFTFDRLCDTYNTMIGVIDYEDYRTNYHLGTVWTSDTWLPDGYNVPDVELAIFHFKERCTTDQTVVSQIQWQQPSTRSFMYDGTCYAKTTLMKVDGYVYDASVNVGILDLRTFSPRGPINTILSPSPYIGEHVNLYIGKVFNNSRNAVRPVGYVRTYDVGIDHASTKKFDFNVYRMADYKSVYDSTAVPDYAERFELEEIQTYSPYSDKYVWIGPAMGKGSEEAYSYNGVCAMPALPSILPGSTNNFSASPIKIPITGEILKIRTYLPVYDELIRASNSLEDNSRLKTFNLQEYTETGWQWLTLDLSRYVGIGYLTFAMRPNSTSEPLLDVYYFEAKKENNNV